MLSQLNKTVSEHKNVSQEDTVNEHKKCVTIGHQQQQVYHNRTVSEHKNVTIGHCQ